jgi:rhodanese-related sulfurtransferase
MSVKTISVGALLTAHAEGRAVDLIDVRTPAEFRTAHARGARSKPLDRLDPPAVMGARIGDSADPLYIICQSGTRARQACERFIAAGFSNVAAVEGGTVAWDEAGGPVVRGKQALTLERQVRITAGLLVVLGSVLALAVNLWFALLAAVVGAGLVFAGVTDTCGMGMLLTRMPWNQVRGQSSRCDADAAVPASEPSDAMGTERKA